MPIKSHLARLAFAMSLAAALFIQGGPTPAKALAKNDENRVRFYGLIEQRPEALHGTWVIGGRVLITNQQTEFEQEEGPLQIGGCAKVDIRNGRVHEIDSESPSNCP